MLTIDGSFGEGGGQILRTSLALSLVTGQPFRLKKIRANRNKPGLLRQHLTCVLAATEIGGARTEGAALRSNELVFRPGTSRPGEYTFKVGTAGSACLVLQALLPALLRLDGPTTLHLEGGTHNGKSPPYDFIERAFLPQLRRTGVGAEVWIERSGFYPAGGGRFGARIEPTAQLSPFELLERGALQAIDVRALVSGLPRSIANRELKIVRERLGAEHLGAGHLRLRAEEEPSPRGPGNAVMITVESEHVTEVFTAFGRKRRSAEDVAEEATEEALSYLAGEVPVGEHLADQLLIPMALAGGGRFRTGPLSLHTRTNIEIIKRFLDVRIEREAYAPGRWEICVG